MRVMWVVSQITPDMAQILNRKKSAFGGWVQNMINELQDCSELEITLVGCADVAEVISSKCGNVQYYILPISGPNKEVSAEQAQTIVEQVEPDIIHIEGTEFSISNVFSRIQAIPKLISLQGILAGYEKYQYGNLSIADMMFSLKYAWAGWGLFLRKQHNFSKRIAVEIDTIKNADYLLGRTIWDRAHSYKYNTQARYFECPRILRKEFYCKEWSYDNCKRHSLFVGNGYSALKGAHVVMEAVAQLRKEFPDIHLYIAGACPYDTAHGVKGKIGYASFIKRFIREHDLENYVTYYGELPADRMMDAMLNSNVYVLPSLIENSPNTLGEAMSLGVPAVSAYTGGVPSMAIDEKEILMYRADDPTMLAWQIKRVFDDIEAAQERARAAKQHAMNTHDAANNRNIMLHIYKSIMEERERA